MIARALASALLTVCSSTAMAADRPTLPPYAGAYQPQGTDEKGLWQLMDEDERQLRDSKFVVDDGNLKAYLQQVLCGAVGQDRCRSVRMYLVRESDFNASMAPNGTMRINTGLLLRLRSEAELAGILAHEFAHFELRHSVEGLKRARKTTDALVWVGVLGGIDLSALLIGSYFAFNREQEREADLKAAEYLAASPYRVGAMADTWTYLLAEFDATAEARKRRSRRYRGTRFFDTHPSPANRRDYLTKVAASTPGGGEARSENYRTAVAPWLGRLIEDQIALNDFGGSDYILGQRADGSWSTDLLYARGELYRRRGHPRDLVSAAGFYTSVVRTDPQHHEAWRGLGLVLLRNGDPVGGKAALQRYLDNRPQANDAGIIKAMLQ